MAGIKMNLVVFMATIMLASMQFHGTAAQTTHVVGDALGWTIPPGGASDYTTWASRQTFAVGDVLLFNFTTGPHTVAEVAQAAYAPCTTANPISVATTGPARITLNAVGTHYYVCTIGTHCQLGQKLTINVAGASAAPAPAPAALSPVAPPTTAPTATPTPSPTPSAAVSPPTYSPSPSGSPTPSPAGSPTSTPSGGATSPTPSGSNGPSPTDSATPAPPADSFAPSITAAVPVTLLAMILAFFY